MSSNMPDDLKNDPMYKRLVNAQTRADQLHQQRVKERQEQEQSTGHRAKVIAGKVYRVAGTVAKKAGHWVVHGSGNNAIKPKRALNIYSEPVNHPGFSFGNEPTQNTPKRRKRKTTTTKKRTTRRNKESGGFFG